MVSLNSFESRQASDAKSFLLRGLFYLIEIEALDLCPVCSRAVAFVFNVENCPSGKAQHFSSIPKERNVVTPSGYNGTLHSKRGKRFTTPGKQT